VGGLYIRLFPAAETVSKEEVVSVNGVGDTFLGVLVAGLAKGLDLDENLISVAQKAAVMTLKSKEAVSPQIASLSGELESIIPGTTTLFS
jgi:pseudouridylate synthase / pseudouridine kinase